MRRYTNKWPEVTPLVVAVLDTFWTWRGYGLAGQDSPRFFIINPENHSGRRLYRLVDNKASLLVTNVCRIASSAASKHSTPDLDWLRENLSMLEQKDNFRALLVCGKIAQGAYDEINHSTDAKVISIMHPAARTWTGEITREVQKRIRRAVR